MKDFEYILPSPSTKMWCCLFINVVGTGTLSSGQKTFAESTLVFNSSSIIENGTFTMQCITNELFSQWFRNSNNSDQAVIGYSDDNCRSTSFIKDQPQMFNYSCYNNDTFNIFSFTLKSVSRYRDGETWYCRGGISLAHSNQVVVHVLVPVLYVTILDGNSASVFTTQENTRNMFTCISSYSRPAANITWYITDGLVENNQHVIGNSNSTYDSDIESTRSITELNLNRTYNGWMLVCKAQNVPQLKGTFHNVTLNITYPPFVNITLGRIFTVKETDIFSFTCPVIPGNPTSTTTTWRRLKDAKTWSSSKLIIPIVTRYDDSVYTCYASNRMVNPNGTTKVGNVSVDIRLNVQFKTNVTDFYIRGYGNNISVVVMETTHLVFTCRLQSNPTSDVRLYEMGTVVNSSNANELLYYTRASCSGGPVSYSCLGKNSLNIKPSIRLIQLIVRCTPKVDMKSNVQFIVTSALNQTATMSYTALAYPYPSFVWYRNGSSINSRVPRVNIFSTDLQTHLIINHVREGDFGEYTLTVTNHLGSINESFHLKAQEHTVQSFHKTSQNIWLIVSGTLGAVVVVVLCSIVFSVCIYRRRCLCKSFNSATNNGQPEISTVNLKIDQQPIELIEYQRETANVRASESTVDHMYEEISPENKGKDTEYTCLGENSKDGK